MALKDLVRANRSYRRFEGGYPISLAMLRELVGLARFCGCGGNMQSLRFALVYEEGDRAAVFPHLRWAAYYRDWDGPAPGERPSGYIVIVGDKQAGGTVVWDGGIAAQTMLLGAVEMGLGGCMIASMDRAGVAEALGLSRPEDVLLVLALGKPAEAVAVAPMPSDGSVRYWRDEAGVHHVPKRDVDDLIVAR